MKNVVRLALALCAFAIAAPANAQQQARPTLGFGISMMPFAQPSALLPTAELYLPIRIAPAFRLEPSLGIFSRDVSGGNKTRDFTLGVGGFWVKPIATPGDMYVGARLKLNFARVENAAGVSDSGTDFSLAAALGGEYYVVPQFSVGLEGQLGLYQNSTVSGDDSGFFTTGLAFLRLYFF
jgi:hypothetical protein